MKTSRLFHSLVALTAVFNTDNLPVQNSNLFGDNSVVSAAMNIDVGSPFEGTIDSKMKKSDRSGLAPVVSLPHTLTFDTTDGADLGAEATDGEGGSSDIDGRTFNIYISNTSRVATGDNVIFDNTNSSYNGLAKDINPGVNGFDAMVIKTADGSEFDFNGLTVINYLSLSATITFEGFKDGSSTGTAITFTQGTSSDFETAVYDESDLPDSEFGDVDEVLITAVNATASDFFGTFNAFALDEVSVAADNTAPVFDVAASVSSVTTSGFTVGASIDEGGDIYFVVVADGAIAPTTTNIIAGQANGGGSVLASGSATGLSDPFTLSAVVNTLNAGTAYDVYFVARDDESTPNVQASVTKVDVTTSAPSSLKVAATVYLEGAYNGTNLNTTINGVIPTTQPFTFNGHSGGTASSIPANAVDWIVVELRETTSGSSVGGASGFLMNDGSTKATNGTDDLTVNLSGNSGITYYVVIYHRNHIPIMSSSAIDGSSGTLTIDFTTNQTTAFGTNAMKLLSSSPGNVYGMFAGDADGNLSVEVSDLSTWRGSNGAEFVYGTNGRADLNLDGVINAVDRNEFQQKNNTVSNQVPNN